MNYNDPNNPHVMIEEPAPGHFVIIGHNPVSVLVPDVGHVVPPRETYVAPQTPSSALIAILEARGDMPLPSATANVENDVAIFAEPPRKAGRPRKETVKPEGAE